MLRTHQGGTESALTPTTDVAALQNEHVLYVPNENYRNPSREAKHQQELLKDYSIMWGQWHISVFFRTIQLFQELLFKLVSLKFSTNFQTKSNPFPTSFKTISNPLSKIIFSLLIYITEMSVAQMLKLHLSFVKVSVAVVAGADGLFPLSYFGFC